MKSSTNSLYSGRRLRLSVRMAIYISGKHFFRNNYVLFIFVYSK